MEVKGADRYRPELLPALEKAMDEQAAGAKPFSLDAALAVLRLYALQPSSTRPETVAKTLLRALTQLPSLDYRTCLFLVPERAQAEEPVSTVVLLAAHLEGGRLADFWALATGSAKELSAMVPGFMDAARRYISHTLAITFARIPKRQAAEALRLEGKELDAYLSERSARDGWSVDGDFVVLPKSDFNAAAVKRAAAELTVPFGAVASALMA